MTTIAITTQSLKDATKAIRALVRERTGQDIAHASVLNTLVAGLGLGRNHGAFMAALPHHQAAAHVVFDTPPTTTAIVHAPEGSSMIPITPAMIANGWKQEDTFDDFGAVVTVFTHTVPAGVTNSTFCGWAHDSSCQAYMAQQPKGTEVITATEDDKQYAVDFVYTCTDHLCTAIVSARLWDAATLTSLTEEEALFALAMEIEMANESIKVLDVQPV